AALACQLDKLVVYFSSADPVGEDLPLRIQKGIPVFAAAVIEIATTFGQKWVHQQPALSQVEGNHARCDNLAVSPRLVLVPGRGARRQRLQAHRSHFYVAGQLRLDALAID